MVQTINNLPLATNRGPPFLRLTGIGPPSPDGRDSLRSVVQNLARSYRAAAGGSPLVHVEASLNRVFHADMDRIDEGKGMDPTGRCGQNLAAYESVRGITWEDVLTKGTRHYSEGLSRFCDRKMSEVVGTLGWARAWPESLLQAFFSAAKGVWMVGLLARSAHPAVPMLRVEGGARFEKDYMEDAVAGERVRRLTPVSVRMVVAPGFYVGAGVVKCKVNGQRGFGGKGKEREERGPFT